jgi:hypothetical protein
VQRSSGAIENGWQIEKGYISTVKMTEDLEGGCGIYLAQNPDIPDHLHKPISIHRLCRMNNISDELKEEMMNYLKEQLYKYYD